MPPRNDMAAMDDPVVSPSPSRRNGSNPRSSSKNNSDRDRGKHRSQSGSRQRSGEKNRGERQKPQADDRQSKEQRDQKKKERKSKKKSGGDEKKKQKKKSTREPSSGDNKRSPPNGNPSPAKNNTSSEEAEEGVTVSQFMQQQQSMQDQAASRKNASMRQRMLHQQQQALVAGTARQQRVEQAHYFDEDDAEYDERERGAVVVPCRNIHPNNNDSRPPRPQVVDSIPADHPSSSIIQKYRTCSLCHRTLPRSQFSERDRYSVNLNIASGATCRTCTMTVCAVKLKSMPGTETLLLEYAQRGMQQGMMIMQGGENGNNNGGAPIAGLLESSESNMNNNNALVVRQNTGSVASGIVGKELTLYDGGAASMANGNANNNNGSNIMGMAPKNVNRTFSGKAYGQGDEDRPANIADCKYIDAMLRMPCYLNLNAFGLFKSSADVSVSLAALEAVRIYGTLGEGCFVPHDCDGMPAPENKRGQSDEGEEDENGEKVNPKSIVCLVLNEGSDPRTAVLASQHYGWTTLSIDPSLSEEWDGYHDDIPNFTGYSGTIADYMDNVFTETMIEFRSQSVRHLVIIGMQRERDTLRMRGNAHIDEIRSRYEDVPTTLVSVSLVRKATLAPAHQRAGMCGSKLEKDVGYEPNCSYIDEGVFSECRMVEVWNFHNAEDDDDEESSEGEEEENFQKMDSVGSDYVPKKKRGDEGERRRKEEERRAERRKAKNAKENNAKESGKSAKQKGNTSDWLEERVAEFRKKAGEGKKRNAIDKEEERERQEEVMTRGSLGSLSTKGTIDRQASDPLVRLPSEGLDGLGMHESEKPTEGVPSEDLHRKDSNPFVRTPSQDIDNRDVKDLPGIKEDQVDEDGHGHEEKEDEHGGEEQEQEEKGDVNDDEAEAWSPPDEEVANQVWEKALAKHDQQESFCDQFQEYYGDKGGDHGDAREEDYSDDGNATEDGHPMDQTTVETDHMQKDLPPGWEAIHDPASGDYYYNNWETGEVTWDRPANEAYPAVKDERPEGQEDGSSRVGLLEGAGEAGDSYDDGPYTDDDDDDQSTGTRDSTSCQDEKPAAAANAAHDDRDTGGDAPSLVSQYRQNHSRYSQSNDSTASDFVYDDHSSASSGIDALTGALARWNRPFAGRPPSLALKKSDNTAEEDDLIVWSDDEAGGRDGSAAGEKDDNDTPPPIARSGSGSSIKKQPWHRLDNEEMGGNNDSFIYE